MNMGMDCITWEAALDKMKKGFNKLKAILDEQDESFTPVEFMELYSTVFYSCTNNFANKCQPLYEEYKDNISDYFAEMVLPILKMKQDVFFLREFEKRWSNHHIMVKWLSKYYHYLDRYYVPKMSLPNLNTVAQTCFHDLVYNEMKDKAKDVMLAHIDQERDGVLIDRSLLKNVLFIFIDLGVDLNLYETDFEAPLLESTAVYYTRKASKHILEDSCPDYMLMAEECLEYEKERVSHYLNSTTESKLIEKTQHVLLFLQANQLLGKEDTGLQVMLRDNKVEDLSRMYRIFSKIEKGLEPASLIFKKHIISCGLEYVKEAEYAASQKKADHRDIIGLHEQVFVNKVIELHDKYFAYCKDCFKSNIIFHKALKEAFELLCNKDIAGNTSAEIFSACCDNILKGGGNEKLSDEAIDEKLEKMVTLLVYLHQKDLFAEFFRKKLARRLLNDRNSNFEHELYLLTKLKGQFGRHFTSKLEGMITDLTLAHDTQVEFEKYLMDIPGKNRGIDLSVSVLTSGFWPTYKSLDFNIPAEMANCIEVFKKFHQAKTKHRKLTWLFSLGSCNVIGRFQAKPIELQLSTYQAATLLLFNNSESLSFKEIVTQLNLPHEEVMKVLHSLSCGKYKILMKEPNTKVISQTDIFEFNSKFTDKMKRIKVPLPHIEEKKKVIEDVGRDRRYAIDAAIVRIMKSRKVLEHNQLVLECMQILLGTFKPDVKVIKFQISDLLERDYLERDTKNGQLYKYVA